MLAQYHWFRVPNIGPTALGSMLSNDSSPPSLVGFCPSGLRLSGNLEVLTGMWEI